LIYLNGISHDTPLCSSFLTIEKNVL